MTDNTHPEALRALAEAAAWTGKWYYAGCNTVHCTYDKEDSIEHDEIAHPIPLGVSGYIAAAQPQAVIALLDRIAELESQLESSGFTAADMATASAQGFRDGVASVSASAGSEPVAVAEVSCTHVHGWGTRWIVDADRKLNIPPLGTKLYARPPAPKQGQKDSSRLRKALIRAQQAINSMKVEAETAAQGDKRMMLEACETISNEGLQADMAIRDVLANSADSGKGE